MISSVFSIIHWLVCSYIGKVRRLNYVHRLIIESKRVYDLLFLTTYLEFKKYFIIKDGTGFL